MRSYCYNGKTWILGRIIKQSCEPESHRSAVQNGSRNTRRNIRRLTHQMPINALKRPMQCVIPHKSPLWIPRTIYAEPLTCSLKLRAILQAWHAFDFQRQGHAAPLVSKQARIEGSMCGCGMTLLCGSNAFSTRNHINIHHVNRHSIAVSILLKTAQKYRWRMRLRSGSEMTLFQVKSLSLFSPHQAKLISCNVLGPFVTSDQCALRNSDSKM